MDAFVLNICKIFGNGTKFSRYKVHEYLGMDMDCSQDETMIIFMIKYLRKMVDDFPEVICSTSTTYAEEHIFIVRDKNNRNLLPEDQAQHFHHTVSQFLSLCVRSCPEVQPLVAFLKTRARSPDEYYGGS